MALTFGGGAGDGSVAIARKTQKGGGRSKMVGERRCQQEYYEEVQLSP